MAQLIDQAVLDDKQYLAALKRIDTNITKMTQQADKGFQSVGKSAGVSSVQIGVISGAVQELTSRFIQLGQTAANALIDMTKESVGLASDLETTQAVFEGIFEGNEPAATAALQRIRKESRGLGIDLQGISKAFLPFVGSLDELSKVNRAAAALAIAQPEQGELGARIALQEALSGNMRSLVQRFEIPKTLGKELQAAFDEGGVAAFLTTFEDVMKRMGRDIDQLTDTIQFSFGKTEQNVIQLKAAFGVPITEELKNQLDELNKVLELNFDDFEGLATLAGNVISELLSGFDAASIAQFFADNKQEIAEFLTALKEIVISAKEFADIDLTGGIDVNTLTQAALNIDKIINALKTLKDITPSGGGAFFSGLEGTLAGLFPGITALIEIWQNLDKVIMAVIGTYGLFIAVASKGAAVANNAYQELLVLTGQIEESQKKIIDPQKAYQDAVDETNRAIKEYRNSVQEAADAVDNATIPVKENTEANEDLTDALLRQRQAREALAQLEEDYAAAQAEVTQKTTEAEKDFQEKLVDIDIEAERKRLDIAIEFAQKREDAARQNLQKLEDIQRGYAQDVEDAATDLARKEEDIARKHGEDRIDLERENRQKRVDIERSYRQNLQDIQRQFLIDAEEAEQKRDAVGFLRALKERNQKVQDAQINRQREIQEQQLTNQRKQEELRIQQEREIEEARLANERKLEDLRTNLDRQIEAQNIAYERQLEEIAIGEQRKNEELALARERDIEDAKLAYERKLADLQEALAAELALIEEYAAQRAALMAIAQGSTTYNPDYANATVPSGTSHGPGGGRATTGAVPAGTSHGPPRRQFGGPVAGGMAYTVGERGPELFVPAGSGAIVPNSALVGSNPTSQPAINNISNVRGGNTINVPDAAGLLNNPVAVRQIENIVMRIMASG